MADGTGSKEPAALRTMGSIDSFLRHNTQKLERRTMEAGEMKTVDGKTPYDLIPVEAMEQFALAMKEGADRYEPDDWRKGNGMPWRWLIGAALRHSFALLRGEDIDPKSKLHHGAHLMCCGAMLIYYHRYRWVFTKDDRIEQPRRMKDEP
jgi:hypothetical protein